MKTNFFSLPVPSKKFDQILPESGSALDPDPHTSKMLDPDRLLVICGSETLNTTK
jgi:hypothetical protein